MRCGDFPGGSLVKSPSFNAEDMGSVLGRGTEILHATGRQTLSAQLLSPTDTTRQKPAHHSERSHVQQLRPDTAKETNIFF